jgi:hypothetical protein
VTYFVAIFGEGTVLVRAADMVDAGDIATGMEPDATTIMSLELFLKPLLRPAIPQ